MQHCIRALVATTDASRKIFFHSRKMAIEICDDEQETRKYPIETKGEGENGVISILPRHQGIGAIEL